MKLLRKFSEWRRHRGFFDGMAAALSIFPPTKPAELTFPCLRHSDAEAIAGDWAVVGSDMSRALDATVGHMTQKYNLPNSGRVLTHAIEPKLHGAR
jgi:hypothetical protein